MPCLERLPLLAVLYRDGILMGKNVSAKMRREKGVAQMTSMEKAQQVLDKMDVKCPECGKRPVKQTLIGLDGGMARSDMACCHGCGYVMVHADTGHVVDSTYRNTVRNAARPAYIPLVFVATKQAGPSTRTIGWLNEALPVMPGATASGAGKACGFWGKVKQCLSGLWH